MTTVGLRVKSGYAIGIVLQGPESSPTALERHLVELCDPRLDETRQPYHSGFGEAEADARKIARREKLIEQAAERSVAALCRIDHAAAVLVVGSVIDPDTVGNLHIRAHANEGRLFRTVLETALRARGIDCAVVVEKRLPASARACLKRTEAEIGQTVATFGKVLGRPWRTDEKSAAIGAWMALASHGPRRVNVFGRPFVL
jgi:hypothetical protein